MGELKLNDLDRYHKRSASLILQEYSHCEVPAGCGGVPSTARGRRTPRTPGCAPSGPG
jgi:hypothetical protein